MQPLLLNVDWLAVSVRFHIDEWLTLTADYFYVDMDGTNVWKYRRIVFNQYSEKVATILYKPKSKLIAENAALIEIANEWLYHGKSPMAIIADLRQWRPFAITGLSRVDLCVDFNPTPRQWHHIQALATGQDYIAGKRCGSAFWSVVRCGLLADKYQGMKIPHCQSWGHKTTAVKWKLYYKSKELADAFGGKVMAKPYILDCWDDAGLDRRDVWRLEVSISGGNGLEFRDEPITLDAIHKRPREIFAALYTRRFQVVRNEGHKDRTNDRRVNFLPIGACSSLRTSNPPAESHRSPSITLLRHLLDAIENEEILGSDTLREETLCSLERLIVAADLQHYFYKIVGEDFPTYCETCRLRAAALRDNAEKIERVPMAVIMERAAAAKWL